MLLLVAIGCVRAPAPAPATTSGHLLTVTPVPVPEGAAQREVRVATEASLDGAPFVLGYQPIARTGDRIGAAVFGARTSRSGAAIAEVCEGLDYTGLWKASTGLAMVTHFECQPGAVYLTALDAAADGTLRATSTRAVDTGAIGGGGLYCAGSPSPWDTHLAGQEYEANVRKLLPDGTVSDNFEGYNELAAWWDGDLSGAHPWMYGWMVEVPPEGPPARRWAMGRFSHEIAEVMPDERTVYLTDDSPDASAFFLFQADLPRDLSAGTLYAARFTEGAEGYGVSWVSLGHATDAEVSAVVDRRAAFTDLFDVAEPVGTTCPDGLGYVNVNWGPECLRIRPGMAPAASRLESRRAAALAGATTELVKNEGLAFAPEERSLFLAVSRIANGATAAHPVWDKGGRDDVRLPANRCGSVWRMDLGEGAAVLPSGPYVVTAARALVTGVEEGKACATDAIANPDNLAWIPGTGTLAIAEDTGHHVNNALWFYDLHRSALVRVLTAPVGAEVSGLRWTPDVAGRSYLSLAIQRPFADEPTATDDQKHSIAGVLGPFPAWK
jgi:secreted PhoX family phosphatase